MLQRLPQWTFAVPADCYLAHFIEWLIPAVRSRRVIWVASLLMRCIHLLSITTRYYSSWKLALIYLSQGVGRIDCLSSACSHMLCCNRYDLASPSRALLVKSVSLQAGTICVLFYLCGLLISLVMMPLDERITLLDSSAFTNVTVWFHAFTYHTIHHYNLWLSVVQARSHRLHDYFVDVSHSESGCINTVCRNLLLLLGTYSFADYNSLQLDNSST